ncbi:MAG: aminotransferase class I/II-fold pyridoxal phosphate-dependent enzyme [Thaumarchaeota archaeon]|nr:aminotransferase class I/II-fold pyridoxal phosphate-dependent enzyme [Nitrososphaerota archaeon]
MISGKEVIMLSSNNYLGLASHPRVKRASQEAIERYGCSTGAARRLGGLTVIQKQLEEELAKFKSTDSAVVFTSGYTANVGTIQALMGKEDMIFSDELNHASIVDGCRLSGARVEVFPHSDTIALERILVNSKARKKLVLPDSVFSMDGDIAPVPDLVRLAGEFNASTRTPLASSESTEGVVSIIFIWRGKRKSSWARWGKRLAVLEDSLPGRPGWLNSWRAKAVRSSSPPRYLPRQ